MAEPDETDYLAPDFNPSTLTVPRLRNILLEHNINYPSSAKKSQLVELFDANVTPKAQKLLNARARTKRSTRGIVDVPSSQTSTADTEESRDELETPRKTARQRSSRRVTRPAEAVVEDLDATPLPVELPTTSRRKSAKHPRASDLEAEGPSRRRTRYSIEPTNPLHQEPEPEAWRSPAADSPFSSDNPFQSGSSPPAPPTVSHERRRRTLGPVEPEKRKSSSSRRRTDAYKVEQRDDGIVPPSRKTFDIAVADLKKPYNPYDVEDDSVEAGEEFTPEEQLELVQEQKATGKEVMPPRQRKRSSSSGIGWTAPLTILLAILGGIGWLFREEKLKVGYCGIGEPPSETIGEVQIPDWASVLRPQCEPCPPHAFCLPRLQTECESGFILKANPLSLGGVVPLPPTCEPDGEKAKRVKAVADRAVEELRQRNAKYECGTLVDEDGKKASSPALKEKELKETVSAKRRRGMSEEDFEDLWKSALGEIAARDEVVAGSDRYCCVVHRPDVLTLASTSLARIPLGCAIRRSIRVTLARYLGRLIILPLLLAVAWYTRSSITEGKATEERAKQLASFALDRLATQAALHADNPGAYPEAYISMGHLRDDVLREEFSAKRRAKLWEKVQRKVEQNSNVRPSVREGRHGDVSRVWEWIGAVQAVEDGRPSTERRQSARYSLGPVDSSPVVKEEKRDFRKWEEGSRPVY
ncbi:hypothetical protein EJ06DRAFT_474055 [Trichodelitschia bisporula]|uniref:Sister chromatid separation protein-like protein n=1 Tax=Trichodelitschia bisporula TaxID=703511 RepID=A0A6G1I1Y2_9PEZI|nr:hypothetical protein EJ06DRAFT_474055 [Trichodelitschia bisporula]